MTKISQYSTDVNITGNDKWIGSDAQNYLITKNFTPNNLANYFNGNNVIDIGTSIRYTYQTLNPGEAREQGTISFETERGPQVNFSDITTFLIAKNTLKGNTVTQYLDFLVDGKVILSKASNINTFGYYKVTGIEPWIPNTNFLVVTVDFLEGNGFIYEDLDYLVSLVDKAQDTPTTVWGNITGDIEDQTDLIDYISSQTTIPTLQQVTDVVPDGNVTTNNIKIAGLELYDGANDNYSSLIFSDGSLIINNAVSGFQTYLDTTAQTDSYSYQFPNQGGIFALTSDIIPLSAGQNINIISNVVDVDIPAFVNTSAVYGTTGSSPVAITIDSSGNIYTANNASNNVSKITPAGVSTILGTTGSNPNAITIDSLGNIYTANSASNNVTKITPSGISTTLAITGNNPIAITVDSSDNIYTANTGTSNVTKITSLGVATTLGSSGITPTAIALDSLGNVYIPNQIPNTVTKITSSGVSTIFGSTGQAPLSIAIDSLNNVYTANYNSNNVTKITPAGVRTTLGTTGSNPDAITIDLLGNVYTANQNSSNVTKITPLGVSTTFGSTINSPRGITIDSSGNIYTANSVSNNVAKITLDPKRILAVDDNLNIIRVEGSGFGSQTLAETLIEGNTTDGENISISNGDAILLDNGSMLKKGTIDAGNGGSKGISQICSVGYEHKWEAGRLYIMNDGGTTIREVSHNFAVTPTGTDDVTKGFVQNTRWILDNGDVYLCTDPTTGAAVWELVNTGTTPTLQQVLDNNHDLSAGNFFAGNAAGLYNIGTDVNALGAGAGSANEGVSLNALGIAAGYVNLGDNVNALGCESGYVNAGNNVNAFGYFAGKENTFNNVNLFGKNSTADEDGQTVLSKDGTIMARISTTELTDSRKYNLPDADGTIALTSDIPTAGVTSVDLTMPSAFTVSGNPVTSSGTLAVTATGVASQYIRGDGTLATLPTSASGGSSISYYLNGGTAASVATYYQMSEIAVVGTGVDFSKAGNGLISQWLTGIADPNRLEITAGNWNFEMYMSASSSGGTPAFYVELLKYSIGGTFTFIANSSAVPEAITGGTSIDLYLTSLAIPQTTLLVTDRLAIRVYIVNSTGGRTITMHTQDSHLCQIITNFAGGVTSLNGLTTNTQYFDEGITGTDFNISSNTDTHTFNLPTASATNRGALSTTDWTTFNNKQNASTRRNANNSANSSINYCGVALGTGVSEGSAVWTITRLTISISGSITIATATNVAWTNRESAIYT